MPTAFGAVDRNLKIRYEYLIRWRNRFKPGELSLSPEGHRIVVKFEFEFRSLSAAYIRYTYVRLRCTSNPTKQVGPRWQVQVLSPNNGHWSLPRSMEPASFAHWQRGHFSEFRYAFDTDWRQRTTVLNASSDLWQLGVYTWQARQILVTESCPPVIPWDG